MRKGSKPLKSEIKWTDIAKNAFTSPQTALCTAPVLNYPENGQVFILDTDASDHCIRAALAQRQYDCSEKVLCNASNKYLKSENNYCKIDRYLLLIIKCILNWSKPSSR